VAFRSDELANRARVEALDAQMAELRSENEALRAAQRGPRRTTGGAALSGGLAVLLLVASVYSAFGVSGYVGERVGVVLAALATLLLALAAMLAVLSRLLVIVRPDQAVVLSGRNRRLADGRVVGYRVVIGGRVLRLPLLERADHLDLRPMRLELHLSRVNVKGGRADLRMHAMARIAPSSPALDNAIERLLGRERAEIETIASDTLEGGLRMVAAYLTVEELQQDAELVSNKIVEQMDEDFRRLGLELEQARLLDVQSFG
jgi:uncharacterized membrane protein YqiK